MSKLLVMLRNTKLTTLAKRTALLVILFFFSVLIWAAVKVYTLAPGAAAVKPCKGPFSVAVVANEDGHFYEHHGFDFGALRSAVIANIAKGGLYYGGSTISQQVSKNLFLSNDRTITRKILEVFLTLFLELRFSKEDILGLYVNHISYGMGQVGIEKASEFYFGKAPEALSLSQAVLLVSLIPANPKELPSEQALINERRKILGRIGYWFPKAFSEEELSSADSEPINFRNPQSSH